MVESQHDETDSIQAFLKWVKAEVQWCHGTGSNIEIKSRYMRTSTLKSYLERPRIIEALLDDLYPNGHCPDADYVRNNYLRPFAILLRLGQGHFIRIFTNYEHLQDPKLPFRSKPQNFPLTTGTDLWEAFKSQQWEFCPLVLRYNMSNDLDPDEILPLEFEDQIGYGGTSSVHKVKVDGEYNELISNAADSVKVE